MKEINAKTATFSMPGENILQVVMKENAEVTLDDARENYEAAMQLTGGKRYVVLVDALAYSTITEEATEFSSRSETYKNVIAMAIVVRSLANRLLANFLMMVLRRNHKAQMKLFNDHDAALTWLKKMLEEDKNGKKKKNKKLAIFSSY